MRNLNSCSDLTIRALFIRGRRRSYNCLKIVAQHPQQLAILYGDERWTYRELNERVDDFETGHIRSFGIGAGDVVGLIAERSVEMLVRRSGRF